MKPPKLPAKEVIESIEKQIGRMDRTIFDEQLATAIACGPSKTSWRKKAKSDPESWTRAVLNLARLRGYSEKRETVNLTPKMKDVADELVRRFGEEGARVLLKAAGAPESVLPRPAIDATSEDTPPARP